MIRIGIVDMDTGHGAAFTKRINQFEGVRVTGIFDHGDVRSRDEVAAFCKLHDCVHCQSLDALAQIVDGVMVLGVDWNKRFSRAATFINRHIPVFICKPSVGSVVDLEGLIQMQHRTGSLVMAGSGWRWAQPTQSAAARLDLSQVTQVTVHSPNPRFYYGIHAWELLTGLLGPGIQWIERLDETDGCTRFACEHRCGAQGLVIIGGARQRVIQWTDQQGDHELELAIPDIHMGFCWTFVQMIRTGQMPADIASQLEPVRCALLAEQACERGQRQSMAELELDRGVSSNVFMDTYTVKPLIPVGV